MAHAFIEHLLEDHKQQRQLAALLSQATTLEDKGKYRQALYDALYPHIEGEDASIFDFLKQVGGETRMEALEAMQEHHIDRILLREIMALDLDDEVLTAKAKVLEEVNDHHLDEEEEEHFPRLVGLASNEELDELFEKYESREEQVKQG